MNKIFTMSVLFSFGCSAAFAASTTKGNQQSVEQSPKPGYQSNSQASIMPESGANPSYGIESASMLMTNMAPNLGEYIADERKMSLYMFASDKPNESTCYDACAKAWPPLVASSEQVQVSGNAQSSLVGAIQRRDGVRQVTYAGHPLYLFVKDRQPGDVTGQGILDFGARWYLMAPNGQMVGGGGGY